MEEVPGTSFYYEHDPGIIWNDGGTQEDVNAAYDRISAMEKLYYFVKDRIGTFSSEWQFQYGNMDFLAGTLPEFQTGFGNLARRWRERQFQCVDLADIRAYLVRCLFVRRRSTKHDDVPVTNWAVKVESLPSTNYQQKAMAMLGQHSQFDSLLSPASDEKMMLQQLLTPIILDEARRNFCLKKLEGHAKIMMVAEGKWQLSLPSLDTADPLIRQCMSTAVGDFLSVSPPYEPSISKKLMVKGTADGQLELEHGIGEDHQQLPRFMQDPKIKQEPIDCKIKFLPCNLSAKVCYTATVDLLTCMGDRFLNVREKSRPPIGLPLIKASQLRRLKEGQGFYMTLNEEQRHAVVKILENKYPLAVITLFGPAGTGKTLSLVEVILQLAHHHIEKRACDAAVHMAVPTNSNSKKMVKQLLKSGVPAEKIVWLVSDQYKITPDVLDMPVQPTRVKDYRFKEHHQVFVGTPAVLSRLSMSVDREYLPPPLVVIVDEVPSLPFGVAAGPLTQNGEPVLIIMAGDTMQMEPRALSKLSDLLHGRKSLVHPMLNFSLEYWMATNEECMCPSPWAGVRLTKNYRAFRDLTDFVSDTFYDNDMVPDESKTGGENMVLYEKMNQIPFSTVDVDHPLLWLNNCSEVVRDPETLSLFNLGEAEYTARVISDLIPIFGIENVMVTSPYRAQTLLLKNASEKFPGLLVGTLEELQGQERDVILVSLTRSRIGERKLCSSSRLGFLTDAKRANVMITRARQLVILIGCSDHFYDSGEEMWRKIINFAQFVHPPWA